MAGRRRQRRERQIRVFAEFWRNMVPSNCSTRDGAVVSALTGYRPPRFIALSANVSPRLKTAPTASSPSGARRKILTQPSSTTQRRRPSPGSPVGGASSLRWRRLASRGHAALAMRQIPSEPTYRYPVTRRMRHVAYSGWIYLIELNSCRAMEQLMVPSTPKSALM